MSIQSKCSDTVVSHGVLIVNTFLVLFLSLLKLDTHYIRSSNALLVSPPLGVTNDVDGSLRTSLLANFGELVFPSTVWARSSKRRTILTPALGCINAWLPALLCTTFWSAQALSYRRTFLVCFHGMLNGKHVDFFFSVRNRVLVIGHFFFIMPCGSTCKSYCILAGQVLPVKAAPSSNIDKLLDKQRDLD